MWMSVIGDFHDSICSCTTCYAHLLDLIFPEGHKDKDKTIRQILERDLQCLSGGNEEEDLGMAAGTSAADYIKEENADQDTTNKEDIDELLAAVADAERR